MRLLEWMQHKLCQNITEPFKDFTSGSHCTCFSAKSSLNDQDSHSKPTFGTRYECRSSQQSRKERTYTSEFELKREEANSEDEEEGFVFHGFLTIGTLGSEKVISDPETPTFTTSLDNIAQGKTDVTVIDSTLINDKLEKFLEPEEKGSNESSTRNSHSSTITFSGKPMGGAKLEDYGTVICPLQGYVFGSSIELVETRTEGKKEEVSLAELFNREKVTHGSSTEKSGKEEMQARQTGESVKLHIMKILNKLQSSSRCPNASPKETHSVSTKKRVQKVIKMLHRKIHPKSSDAEGKLKNSKEAKINNSPHYGSHIEGGKLHQDKDNCKLCQKCCRSQEGRRGYKTNSKQPQNTLAGSNSSGNREHWNRTDANSSHFSYKITATTL